MSCPDPEILSSFADGELEVSAMAGIKAHLSTCPACREFVDEMRSLNSLGRSSLQAVRAPYTGAFVAACETARRRRWLAGVALAAAATIVGSLSFIAWFTESRPQSKIWLLERVPITSDGARAPASAPLVDGAAADAAFERWAAPYRQLRIPLVPVEELADYHAPDLPPMVPDPNVLPNGNDL